MLGVMYLHKRPMGLFLAMIFVAVNTAPTGHADPARGGRIAPRPWGSPLRSPPAFFWRSTVGYRMLRGGNGWDEEQPGCALTEAEQQQLWESAWSQDFSEKTDPLFMQGLTEEEAEHARQELIDGIMRDEDNEYQLCEYWKEEGNKYTVAGAKIKNLPVTHADRGNYTKLYAQAIRCYSTAIKHARTHPLVRIQCHANRASAHLERGNYGYAFSDSLAAVNLSAHAASGHAKSSPLCICSHDPYEAHPECGVGEGFTAEALRGTVKKSLGRAARACSELERWREAADLCKEGLAMRDVKWGDSTLKMTLNLAEGALQIEEQQRKHAEEEEVARRKKLFTLQDAIRSRGVIVGASKYAEILKTQGVDVDFSDWGGGQEAGGTVCWPVLFIYDEERQSDFLKQCCEDTTVEQHLEAVLGNNVPPPWWDQRNRYTPSSVSVHIITYQAPILANGKRIWIEDANTGRRCKMEWSKVDTSNTLAQVLMMDGHVVPRVLVLHITVKGSGFEEHMLGADAEDFAG